MSLPRPSGIKQPSRIGRPSGLPTTRPVTPSAGNNTQNNATVPTKAMSAIAKSARGIGYSPERAEQYADKVSKDLKGPEPLDDRVCTDDFKIADRIWVSGNKPGIIAFIGETQFAPGEWAGIVLDEPIGKNDGSVMGIRYFQCEPKRGVFSRLNKLSHMPQPSSRRSSQGHDSNSSDTKLSNPDLRTTASNGTTNGTPPSNSNVSSRPSSRLGLSASKNLSTSSSSLHKASSAGSTPTGTGNSLTAGKLGGVKVGDRVLVSGSKSGILRFIGETDFAKGVWAGVELEEPLGKNDGAVAGKRYFECKPMHGLFAPIHKISQVELGILTPSPHSRPAMSTSLRSSRERSGSQESVSSMSSTASSVSRSRLTPRVDHVVEASKTGQRPNSLNLSATTAALQKALKEKEEHIEQLLRERDLERSEVARAAAHVDEAESQLTYVKTEQSKLRMEADEQIAKYQILVADLENEKQELLAFLEEEKRRVEDLQFQLEEETLKDETDSKASATNELQMKELERQMKKEKDRADNLEKDLNQIKKKLEDQQKANHEAKSAQTSSQDQIEELTHKLAQAESKVRAFELNRLEDGAKVTQVSMELVEKQHRVKEMEDQLVLQRREMSSMSQQLNELMEELRASNDKRKKQDEYIKELVDKLKETENKHNDMMDEIRNANSNTADLQRQLSASKTKAEELASERAILESQLSKLMTNSGDSSSQLATLNDQLTDRNRKIEGLQNDLSNFSQRLAKSQEEYQVLLQEKDREIQQATQNFGDRVSRLEDEIRDLKSNEEKYTAKISQLSETFELEKHESSQRKDTEVRELQQQLSHLNNELGKQQDKTTAHKQLLEKVTLEKEAVQYERQQSEKQLRRVEEEKSAINTELIQARVEATRHQEEVQKSRREKMELQDKVEKLNLQVEHLMKANEEAEKSKDEVRSQKTDIFKELDLVKKELVILREEVQKKNKLLEDKQKEVDKLQTQLSKTREELMSKSQTEIDQLRQQINALTKLLQDEKQQVESRDQQITDLLVGSQQNATLTQERDLLIKEKTELLKEKELSEERYRNSVKEVERESHKVNLLQSDVLSLKSAEEDMKQRKLALEVRVRQLESELEQVTKERVGTSQKTTTDKSELQQLKEEADFASRQVDFLNSVIVELQNKNQDLQHRLSAMEDSGIHTNGDITKTLETPSRIRAPPRLFCDICDEFDRHDTEDCPRQATSNSPEPTSYHGDRRSTRPYCDTCEELCACGGLSTQAEVLGWEADAQVGVVGVSSTPAMEKVKLYAPPEGFNAGAIQNSFEDIFFIGSHEANPVVLVGQSQTDTDNGKSSNFQNQFWSGFSNMSAQLTGYITEDQLDCHFGYLPPKLFVSSTTQKPDLLQSCHKTLATLSQRKNKTSTLCVLAEDTQEIALPDRDDFCGNSGNEAVVGPINGELDNVVQDMAGRSQDNFGSLMRESDNWCSDKAGLGSADCNCFRKFVGDYLNYIVSSVKHGSGDVLVEQGSGDVLVEQGDGDVLFEQGSEDVLFEQGSEDLFEQGSGDVLFEQRSGDVLFEQGSGDVLVKQGSGDVLVEQVSVDLQSTYRSTFQKNTCSLIDAPDNICCVKTKDTKIEKCNALTGEPKNAFSCGLSSRNIKHIVFQESETFVYNLVNASEDNASLDTYQGELYRVTFDKAKSFPGEQDSKNAYPEDISFLMLEKNHISSENLVYALNESVFNKTDSGDLIESSQNDVNSNIINLQTVEKSHYFPSCLVNTSKELAILKTDTADIDQSVIRESEDSSQALEDAMENFCFQGSNNGNIIHFVFENNGGLLKVSQIEDTNSEIVHPEVVNKLDSENNAHFGDDMICWPGEFVTCGRNAGNLNQAILEVHEELYETVDTCPQDFDGVDDENQIGIVDLATELVIDLEEHETDNNGASTDSDLGNESCDAFEDGLYAEMIVDIIKHHGTESENSEDVLDVSINSETLVPEDVLDASINSETLVPEDVLYASINRKTLVPGDVLDASINSETLDPEDVLDASINSETLDPEDLLDASINSETLDPEDVLDASTNSETLDLEDVLDASINSDTLDPEDVLDASINSETLDLEDVLDASINIERLDPEDMLDESINSETPYPEDVSGASISSETSDPDDVIDASINNETPDPEDIDVSINSETPDPEDVLDTSINSEIQDPEDAPIISETIDPQEVLDASINFETLDPEDVLDASINFETLDPEDVLDASINFENLDPEDVLDASINFETLDPEDVLDASLNFETLDPEDVLDASINSETLDPEDVLDASINSETLDPEDMLDESINSETLDPEDVLDASINSETLDPEDVLDASINSETLDPEDMLDESMNSETPDPEDIDASINNETLDPEDVLDASINSKTLVPEDKLDASINFGTLDPEDVLNASINSEILDPEDVLDVSINSETSYPEDMIGASLSRLSSETSDPDDVIDVSINNETPDPEDIDASKNSEILDPEDVRNALTDNVTWFTRPTNTNYIISEGAKDVTDKAEENCFVITRPEHPNQFTYDKITFNAGSSTNVSENHGFIGPCSSNDEGPTFIGVGVLLPQSDLEGYHPEQNNDFIVSYSSCHCADSMENVNLNKGECDDDYENLVVNSASYEVDERHVSLFAARPESAVVAGLLIPQPDSSNKSLKVAEELMTPLDSSSEFQSNSKSLQVAKSLILCPAISSDSFKIAEPFISCPAISSESDKIAEPFIYCPAISLESDKIAEPFISCPATSSEPLNVAESLIPYSAISSEPLNVAESLIPCSATSSEPLNVAESLIPCSATSSEPLNVAESLIPCSAISSEPLNVAESPIPCSATSSEPLNVAESLIPCSATSSEPLNVAGSLIPCSAISSESLNVAESLIPCSATSSEPLNVAESLIPCSATSSASVKVAESLIPLPMIRSESAKVGGINTPFLESCFESRNVYGEFMPLSTSSSETDAISESVKVAGRHISLTKTGADSFTMTGSLIPQHETSSASESSFESVKSVATPLLFPANCESLTIAKTPFSLPGSSLESLTIAAAEGHIPLPKVNLELLNIVTSLPATNEHLMSCNHNETPIGDRRFHERLNVQNKLWRSNDRLHRLLNSDPNFYKPELRNHTTILHNFFGAAEKNDNDDDDDDDDDGTAV